MPRNFYYGKGADVVAGAANFAANILTNFASLGLTNAQATAFGLLNTALQGAWSTATDPETRTRMTIASKELALSNMRADAVRLAKIIYATPTVTDAQLLGLGLLPRTVRTPVPPPLVQPMFDIVSVNGRTVKCRVHGATGERRGKPAGVAMAFIYSFVGDVPPTDPSGFNIEGTTTRPTFDVVFPSSVAGGSQVWLAAAWANARTQTGPACPAVNTYLQGASSVAA